MNDLKTNKELISFTIENTWTPKPIKHEVGWGNGYVAIPPTSSLHKLPFDVLEKLNTYQEITMVNYAGEWNRKPDNIPDDYIVVGFDTCHSGNNPIENDKQWVENQTEQFLKELKDIEHKGVKTAIPYYYVHCPNCQHTNNLDFDREAVTDSFICNNCNKEFYCCFKSNEDKDYV